MEREKLIRDDFPVAPEGDGFDRASVTAHLSAVAAHVAALESEINALEVERDALRRRLGAISPDEPPTGSHPVPFTRTGPPRGPGARVNVLPENGHRAGSRFGRVTRRAANGPEAPGADAPPTEPPRQAGKPSGNDEVAARLTASTLALEGADRETIRQRLAAEYELADPDGLLDDVLARLA